MNITLKNGKTIEIEISENGNITITTFENVNCSLKNESGRIGLKVSKAPKSLSTFFKMPQIKGKVVLLQLPTETYTKLTELVKETQDKYKEHENIKLQQLIDNSEKKIVLSFPYSITDNAEVVEIYYNSNYKEWKLSKVLFVMPRKFYPKTASDMNLTYNDEVKFRNYNYKLNENEIEILKGLCSELIAIENKVKGEIAKVKREQIEKENSRIEILTQQAKETGKRVLVSTTVVSIDNDNYSSTATVCKFVNPDGAFTTSEIDNH